MHQWLKFALTTLILLTLALGLHAQGGGAASYGGAKDVAFAQKLWKAMDGYENWKLTTPVYKGGSPHGKWVRLYSTWVTVDGRSYPIIIKDNFGGRGVKQESASAEPAKWRKAITIMLQPCAPPGLCNSAGMLLMTNCALLELP